MGATAGETIERPRNDLALARLLRRHRVAAGLTQEELAEAARLSTRSISDLERGITRRTHKDTARLLIEALGLDEAAARQFFAVARGVPAADGGAAGSPAVLDVAELPTPEGPLVGRESEVTAALAQLGEPGVRILTVTGAAGVGKTRVALETASRWRAGTGAPALFVGLAHLRDEELVVPAVVRGFGLRTDGTGSAVELLARHIGRRAVLVVLDNMEQLLGAAGEVARIVAACPGVTVLVTSRSPLRVQGERELVVPPLAVPPGSTSSPAVELFLQRAADVAPQWRPGPEDLAAIAELCRAVDGLPLAIELAAAWMRMLSPRELLHRRGSRLDVLNRGSRDAPSRHRTLRAALDWSVELLSPPAAVLLRRLAVCPGGWTLDDAEGAASCCESPDGLAAGLVLDALAELVEANLARRDVGAAESRFRMLTVVQEYAHELLIRSGESAAVLRWHTSTVVARVERCAAGLQGPAQKRALAELDVERENIGSALERCIASGDVESSLRIAGALWPFWEIRGPLAEGRRWLDRALALPGDPSGELRAAALKAAGALARDQHDVPAAQGHLDEALRLYRLAGSVTGTARVLNNLGNVALDSGDLATAVRRYRESLAAFEGLGDSYHAALVRNNLALALRRTGDVDVGGIQALLDQSLAAFQGLGDPRGVARATGTKARVLDAAGDHRAALPLHVEALALRRDLGDLCGLINSLEGLSLSLAKLGRPRLAAQLIGHASAMREREGEPRDSDDDVEVDAAVAAITTALGDEELEAELQRGRDASLDELLPDDLALPPER